MMNNQTEYRNQRFDGSTGSMSYRNEYSPDGDKDANFGEKMHRMATPLEKNEWGSDRAEGKMGDRQDTSEDQPNNHHNHKNLVALWGVGGSLTEKEGGNFGDMQNRGSDWILKDYKPHYNICYKDPFPY